jgi:hypothetical protein
MAGLEFNDVTTCLTAQPASWSATGALNLPVNRWTPAPSCYILNTHISAVTVGNRMNVHLTFKTGNDLRNKIFWSSNLKSPYNKYMDAVAYKSNLSIPRYKE